MKAGEKTKTIIFSERTLDMIEFIKKREGIRTFSAAVINCIAKYFNDTYFSKQKGDSIKEIEPGLSGEEYCQMLDGKTDLTNNTCRVPLHRNVFADGVGGIQTVSLSALDRKMFEALKKERGY
jgi:hypothetical protein